MERRGRVNNGMVLGTTKTCNGRKHTGKLSYQLVLKGRLMKTLVVPFIYVALVLGIFLFGPQERRTQIQAAARRELNFYIICDLVLVALTIAATLTYRQIWIDYAAWGALVILGGVSARKLWRGSTAAESPSERGPL